MTKKPSPQSDYDRLLKKCEEQAIEISKLRDQIEASDEKLAHAQLALQAERAAQQAAARRRTQDEIARSSWKNGNGA